MSAKKVAGRLHLEASSVALEVGPGSGYYSVEIAKRINKLELYDIQQEMLDKCRKKMEMEGITNVIYTKGNGSIMPYNEAVFDIVYMIAVFGEIEKKKEFLENIIKILKSDGELSITEHHPDPDFTSFIELNEILNRNGFRLQKKYG